MKTFSRRDALAEETIAIKTTFSDWHSISRKQALDYAKWKMKAITMGKDDEERLGMVNGRFRGIAFTLSDLT